MGALWDNTLIRVTATQVITQNPGEDEATDRLTFTEKIDVEIAVINQ